MTRYDIGTRVKFFISSGREERIGFIVSCVPYPKAHTFIYKVKDSELSDVYPRTHEEISRIFAPKIDRHVIALTLL